MSISGARMNWRIDSRTIRAGAQRAHGTSRLRMLRPISALRVAAVRPISALRLAAVRPSSVLLARARLTRSVRPLPMLHYLPQFLPGGYSVRANLAGAAVELGAGGFLGRQREPCPREHAGQEQRRDEAERVLAEPGTPALTEVTGPEQIGDDLLLHADVLLVAVGEQLARAADLDHRGVVAVGQPADQRPVATGLDEERARPRAGRAEAVLVHLDRALRLDDARHRAACRQYVARRRGARVPRVHPALTVGRRSDVPLRTLRMEPLPVHRPRSLLERARQRLAAFVRDHLPEPQSEKRVREERRVAHCRDTGCGGGAGSQVGSWRGFGTTTGSATTRREMPCKVMTPMVFPRVITCKRERMPRRWRPAPSSSSSCSPIGAWTSRSGCLGCTTSRCGRRCVTRRSGSSACATSRPRGTRRTATRGRPAGSASR